VLVWPGNGVFYVDETRRICCTTHAPQVKRTSRHATTAVCLSMLIRYALLLYRIVEILCDHTKEMSHALTHWLTAPLWKSLCELWLFTESKNSSDKVYVVNACRSWRDFYRATHAVHTTLKWSRKFRQSVRTYASPSLCWNCFLSFSIPIVRVFYLVAYVGLVW